MPELPEVETVRRVLQSRLAGLMLEGFHIPKTTFYRTPDLKSAPPRGSILKAVHRRGKYLLLEFSEAKPLTLHLGMSGRLSLEGGGKHVR
ncbi:MAG: DNA-formamidopyrimidine glycosylase family protein, partial [Elusimicrobiota bacterium]